MDFGNSSEKVQGFALQLLSIEESFLYCSGIFFASFKQGSKLMMCRWSPDGASIFSIADGKRLAQTPPKEPTAWELNRARKIAKASVDERVVQGLRLMPEYTPARAMLWGSILAVWGTATITASIARYLDIHNVCSSLHNLLAVA